MIRKCKEEQKEEVWKIINEAAQAYKGIIPADCWKEPYMSKEELSQEMEAGVHFWGFAEQEILMGVMGLQKVMDVALIRHSYVQTNKQRKGIGGKLLSFIKKKTNRPLLVGTWAAASWAISFYEKHGFSLVREEEKDLLLRKYWKVPERQIENSVVLADHRWFLNQKGKRK